VAEFARNSRKHLSTPLTNNVGLGTLVTWRPSTRGEALARPGTTEPWSVWKDAKRAALRSSRPLRLVLAAAFLGAAAFAFRERPAWTAVAAGAGLVFVLADLTCYYASILLLLGLLALDREETGVVTSLLAAATAAVPFLLRWRTTATRSSAPWSSERSRSSSRSARARRRTRARRETVYCFQQYTVSRLARVTWHGLRTTGGRRTAGPVPSPGS